MLRSAAANQFLSVTLGVGGLKRLAKSMDAALTAIHASLIDQVQPAAEQLLFQMSILAGLADWDERLGDVGLRAEAAQTCLARAELVLAASALAAAACCDAARSFRHLFIWLQRCQKRCVRDTRMNSGAIPRRLTRLMRAQAERRGQLRV